MSFYGGIRSGLTAALIRRPRDWSSEGAEDFYGDKAHTKSKIRRTPFLAAFRESSESLNKSPASEYVPLYELS